MEFATLTMSIFDPFYSAFGWIMRVLYDLVNNYGLVIILFTILIRGIFLLPLNIRSQRSMMKQQAVAPLINDIKRRYGDDKQRVQEETMKVYKEHGVKLTAGCLPMILQLIIIIPIWRSIQAPLRYIMNVSRRTCRRSRTAVRRGPPDRQPGQGHLANNIPLLDALAKAPSRSPKSSTRAGSK
jgi:YidC/Oxa1 family membrane protein insertase